MQTIASGAMAKNTEVNLSAANNGTATDKRMYVFKPIDGCWNNRPCGKYSRPMFLSEDKENR